MTHQVFNNKTKIAFVVFCYQANPYRVNPTNLEKRHFIGHLRNINVNES